MIFLGIKRKSYLWLLLGVRTAAQTADMCCGAKLFFIGVYDDNKFIGIKCRRQKISRTNINIFHNNTAEIQFNSNFTPIGSTQECY